MVPRQRGEPRRKYDSPSTGGTEKKVWFPPLAGGTYRSGDETLVEKHAFASENEPTLCTLVNPQAGGTYRRE